MSEEGRGMGREGVIGRAEKWNGRKVAKVSERDHEGEKEEAGLHDADFD